MWLYIPNDKRTSACTRVEADSILLSDERIQQLAVSFTWKETWKPPRSWLTILKRDSWMQHLYGLIPEPSIADRLLEKWIGSLEDSHVSPGVLQESEAPQTTAGGSGHTLKESFARLDPEDSSWKTSQVSLGGDSNLYLKAWPKAGSMRSGVVSKQAMLEPVTEEKGSSSWPTVTTDSVSQRTKKYKSSLWLTPSANEDAAGTLAGNMQNMISHQVQAQAQSGEIFSPDDPTSHQRRLNTKMVTWLMGWPEGWLDMHSFVSSETE